MTTDSQPRPARWGVIAMLAAAQFTLTLDTTILNVAGRQIVEDVPTGIGDDV